MKLEDAIKEADHKAITYGGIWHVVMLNNEHYYVHDAWFKNHKGKSLYNTKDHYYTDFKLIVSKRSLWQRLFRR
jgi:hypothetical protein